MEETKPTEQPAAEQPLPKPTTPKETKDTVTSEDLITKANAAAMRVEEASKALSVQLDRQERMAVEATLGGKTEAGETGRKEESAVEYSKRILRGEL